MKYSLKVVIKRGKTDYDDDNSLKYVFITLQIIMTSDKKYY